MKLHITEYKLKDCKFIKANSEVKKRVLKSSLSKSSSLLSLSSSSSSLSPSFSTVNYVNKNILDHLNINDVILDPAGLEYIQKNMIGASGASGAIYTSLLETNDFNKEVKDFFKKYNENKDLYVKNGEYIRIPKLSISSEYDLVKNQGKINLIHAVGPDFTSSKVLENILINDKEKLFMLFFTLYESIILNFLTLYEKNKHLKLRLLPISMGVFLNIDNIDTTQKHNLRIKIFKIIIKALSIILQKYHQLQQKGLITMYLINKRDFIEYDTIIKKLLI